MLTVPENAFDLQVSAEADAAAVVPSGKAVIERRVEDD